MATMTHRIGTVNRVRHAKLEQLLSQQGSILRNRKQTLRNGLPTEMAGVLDLEEHSLDAEEQALGFSVLALTSQTVQGIETALRRLAAGEFGTCADCQGRISDARLRALPFAMRCLPCQGKLDTAAVDGASPGTTVWTEHMGLPPLGSVGQ